MVRLLEGQPFRLRAFLKGYTGDGRDSDLDRPVQTHSFPLSQEEMITHWGSSGPPSIIKAFPPMVCAKTTSGTAVNPRSLSISVFPLPATLDIFEKHLLNKRSPVLRIVCVLVGWAFGTDLGNLLEFTNSCSDKCC